MAHCLQLGCVKQRMQGRPQRLGTGPAEEFGLYLEGLLDGRGEKCIPDFALCLLGKLGCSMDYWDVGWPHKAWLSFIELDKAVVLV